MLRRVNRRVISRLDGQFDSLPSNRIVKRVKGQMAGPGCSGRNGGLPSGLAGPLGLGTDSRPASALVGRAMGLRRPVWVCLT